MRNGYTSGDGIRSDQEQARAMLEKHNCWEPMWRHSNLPMEEGLCSQLPFYVDAKMIDAYK